MSFSPYIDNGGTCVALAGKGYAIIAADRRCSVSYNILTRECTKILPLTSRTVLASCGMQSDRHTLHSVLKARTEVYELTHEKEMSTRAVSQMLSRTLYYRRFFPYCFVFFFSFFPFLFLQRKKKKKKNENTDTFNVVAGVESNGEGYVYSYDAIGSFEEQRHAVSGSGAELAIPLLDNLVEKQHQSKTEKTQLSQADALKVIKDVMNAVTERDIKTGDSCDIYVITPKGISHEKFPLRVD